MNLRRVPQSSTGTTVTSPQSLDMSSRRTAVVEPSTDLLNDEECSTRRNRCLKRADRESTDAIERYFRDGTPVSRTETRCMPSGGEETHNAARQNRLGETFLRRNKS